MSESTSPSKQVTKMEVISPSLSEPFNFHAPSVSSYISAPSSPQGLGTTFFYSAPSSPARASAFCRQDFHGDGNCSPSSAVPFYWEERPGIPKEEYFSSTEDGDHVKDTDFEFGSTGNFQRCSLSADELFDGGKIRPLKPPPGFQQNRNKPLGSPKSSRSSAKLIVEAFSPRHGKGDFDPFAAALEEARKSNIQENVNGGDKREREKLLSDSSKYTTDSTLKGTRSSTPFRVSDLLSNQEPPTTNHRPAGKASLSSASSFSSLWHKKWKIKDLLLFRSASESWATDNNDQLKKKNSLFRKTHDQDELTESSFSSTASGESDSSRRRSVPPISAHEFHYSVERTMVEEMRKRRSLLPHRQGILGCLGFHQTAPEIHQNL